MVHKAFLTLVSSCQCYHQHQDSSFLLLRECGLGKEIDGTSQPAHFSVSQKRERNVPEFTAAYDSRPGGGTSCRERRGVVFSLESTPNAETAAPERQWVARPRDSN
jgi:hypothetical protein